MSPPYQARRVLTTAVKRMGEKLAEAEEQLRNDEQHMYGSRPHPNIVRLYRTRASFQIAIA